MQRSASTQSDEQFREFTRWIVDAFRLPVSEIAKRAGCSDRTVNRAFAGEPVASPADLLSAVTVELMTDSFQEKLRACGERVARRVSDLPRLLSDSFLLYGALLDGNKDRTTTMAYLPMAVDAGVRLGAYRSVYDLPRMGERLVAAIADYADRGAKHPRGAAGDAFEYAVRERMKPAGLNDKAVRKALEIGSRRTMDAWLKGLRPIPADRLLDLVPALTAGMSCAEQEQCLLELRFAAALQQLQRRCEVEPQLLRRRLRLFVEVARATQETLDAKPWSLGLRLEVAVRGLAAPLTQRLLRGGVQAANQAALSVALMVLAAHPQPSTYAKYLASTAEILDDEDEGRSFFSASNWHQDDLEDQETMCKIGLLLSRLEPGPTRHTTQVQMFGRLMGWTSAQPKLGNEA